MTRPIDRTTILGLLNNIHVYTASSGAGGPHGTVTHVDAQNLTVATDIDGVEYDPRDFEFLGVLESYAASNDGDLFYTHETNDFNFDPTTNRLTVAGANFQAASNFVVFYMDTTRKASGIFWLIYAAIVAGTTHLDRIIAETDEPPPDDYGAEVMGRTYADGALPADTSDDGDMTWLSLTRKGLARVYAAIEATTGLVTELAAGDERLPTMTLDRATRVQDLRMLLAFLGQDAAFHSPDDFTAAQSDTDELTLTGLPFTPTSDQIMGVIEYKTGGTSVFHTIRDGFTFAFASTGVGTGTLTVTGTGVNFEGTSTFVVVLLNQKKAYDAVLNAIQMAQLNARQQDIVSQQRLFEDLVLDASPGDDSAWVNTEGFTELGLMAYYISDELGVGESGTADLYVRILGNDTDAGTIEYPAHTGELNTATPAIDTYDAPIHPPQIVVAAEEYQERWYWWRVKISTGTRVRIQVWEDIADDLGHGTLDMQCKLINR